MLSKSPIWKVITVIWLVLCQAGCPIITILFLKKIMLVLVFSNSEEGSVNNVIDHLIYMGAEVLRITENDIIIIKKIILDQDNFEIEFVVKNINVKYSDIFSVWFRQISQITIQDYEKSANTTVNNFLKNEIASLK